LRNLLEQGQARRHDEISSAAALTMHKLHGGVRMQLITAVFIRRGPENADFGPARVFPARIFSARSASYAIGGLLASYTEHQIFCVACDSYFLLGLTLRPFDTPFFLLLPLFSWLLPTSDCNFYNRPRITTQRNCAAEKLHDANAQGPLDQIQKVPAIEPPRQVMAQQNY
jgi:hypothetical protein